MGKMTDHGYLFATTEEGGMGLMGFFTPKPRGPMRFSSKKD